MGFGLRVSATRESHPGEHTDRALHCRPHRFVFDGAALLDHALIRGGHAPERLPTFVAVEGERVAHRTLHPVIFGPLRSRRCRWSLEERAATRFIHTVDVLPAANDLLHGGVLAVSQKQVGLGVLQLTVASPDALKDGVELLLDAARRCSDSTRRGGHIRVARVRMRCNLEHRVDKRRRGSHHREESTEQNCIVYTSPLIRARVTRPSLASAASAARPTRANAPSAARAQRSAMRRTCCATRWRWRWRFSRASRSS